MAAQGFNVCIVSRNAEKIEDALKVIRSAYPNIETKSVVANFSKMRTIAEY